MKLSGHAAGGVIITRILFKVLKPQSSYERLYFLISGGIAGTMPDWDGLVYIIKKKKLKIESDFRHHTWITHTFVFHLTISGMLYLIGKLLQSNAFKQKALIVGASTSVHLIQDTIGTGDGIMLFYPVTKHMYGIGLSGLHGNEWAADYVKRPIYNVERSLKIIALVIVVMEALKLVKQKLR
ncbi:MAG TPA: metal-dependent hydrolase [Anaerolineales bacterium]|nr:metal-dependent hydrolase [Anaerolineales bacterium]